MDYGMQQAVCPRCGSNAQVRTVSELFDMLNGMQDQAMQQAQQAGQQGPYPGGPGGPGGPYQGPGVPGQQGQGYTYAGGYSESRSPTGSYGRGRSSYDNDPSFEFTGNISEDITNAAIGGAAKFLGRALSKKVQKAVQERVVPAMQARAAQAQQQWQQSRNDQAAIVQRYPDLRGCLQDQVVFLAGGMKTIPINQLPMPITMAGADSVVSYLSAP